MHKRDVLKLKPGTVVVFGDSQKTADVTRWRTGKVLRVTPRAGLRLSTEGGEVWVPYHFVLRVEVE